MLPISVQMRTIEWDDMIHNGIGGMLGDMIGNTILNEWQRLKGNRNMEGGNQVRNNKDSVSI